jgi:hypothetical protein
MSKFTTKLSLGDIAYTVSGLLDPVIKTVTVGKVVVELTMPKYSNSEGCYKEIYMCIETGVGSGILWEYGLHIFATEEEAALGAEKFKQRRYKERAARDAYQAEQAEQKKADDLRTLARLKEKYGEAGDE